MDNNKNKKYYKYNKNYHHNYNNHHQKYYYKKKNKQQRQEDILVENISQNDYETNESYDNTLENDEVMLIKKNSDKEDLQEPKYTYDELVNRYDEPKEENNMEKKESVIQETTLGYVLGILIIVVVLLGTTYAFFNYNGVSERETTLTAGDVYVNTSPSSLALTLTKAYPRTVSEARSRTDNYIDFYVNGMNTSETKAIEYWFTLANGDAIANKTRISGNHLRFDLASLDQSNNETLILSNVNYDTFNAARKLGLYVPINTSVELSQKYRLRMWISEDVLISDTESGATYNQANYTNLYASVKLVVNSQDGVFTLGSQMVKNAIQEKINATSGSCTPTWTDEEDGVIYFSGNNTCVDMNYVWYSGKLWRIVAIYPDGAMKLVTANNMTIISFRDSEVGFDGSYVQRWLNEEFLETLYNYQNILDTTKTWDVSNLNENSFSTRLSGTTTSSSVIGLLNSYEYYNSHRNVTNSNQGFLRLNTWQWLSNPYSNTDILRVTGSTGSIGNTNSVSSKLGIRPAIYLKAATSFTGSGTESDPYHVVGDKHVAASNEKINTRLSGEYVQLSNNGTTQMFRIVSVDNNKAKIVAMDYADNGATKPFATSTGTANSLWGSGATTDTGTWYTYLNGTYYPNLVSTYGNLFDSGVYYLGTSTNDYRLSICANITSGNTRVCDKTSDSGTFNIGLLRYGEMFSAQHEVANAIAMWLMNRNSMYSASYVNSVMVGGSGQGSKVDVQYGARPTVYLKSSVKIISGSGTNTDPYVVGL